MLYLTVHKNFPVQFEDRRNLSSTALKLYNIAWPDDAVAVQEPDNEEEESDEDEPMTDLYEQKYVSDDLFEGISMEALADSLELEGQGQQRHGSNNTHQIVVIMRSEAQKVDQCAE